MPRIPSQYRLPFSINRPIIVDSVLLIIIFPASHVRSESLRFVSFHFIAEATIEGHDRASTSLSVFVHFRIVESRKLGV